MTRWPRPRTSLCCGVSMLGMSLVRWPETRKTTVIRTHLMSGTQSCNQDPQVVKRLFGPSNRVKLARNSGSSRLGTRSSRCPGRSRCSSCAGSSTPLSSLHHRVSERRRDRSRVHRPRASSVRAGIVPRSEQDNISGPEKSESAVGIGRISNGIPRPLCGARCKT